VLSFLKDVVVFNPILKEEEEWGLSQGTGAVRSTKRAWVWRPQHRVTRRMIQGLHDLWFIYCNHPPERLSVISSPLPWVKQQELTHLGVVDRWQLWNGAMLPTHGSFRKRMVKVKFSNFTLHSFVLYTGIPFLLIVSGQKLTSCNLKKEGWAYPWLAVTWKEEITIRESLRQAMSTTSTTFPDLYHVRWFWIWRNDNFWALFMPCP